MDMKKVLTQQNLEQVFIAFDADGSGSISAEEVKAMFGSIKLANEAVYENIIREVDVDGNGEIDMNEFKAMMKKLF